MTAKISRAFALAALVLSLGACATEVPGVVEDPKTPLDRFATPVTSEPEEIRLAIHAQGLSQNQGAALSDFVDGWRERDRADILIQAPNGGGDTASAYRMTEAARAFLLDHGVPADRIEVAGYDPEGGEPAPLIVGYLTHKVEIPKCGEAWVNFAKSWKNDVQPNFGCSVTANIAAQIADPADLASPRTMTPQDATRRQAVLDKYRKGDTTAAQRDENEGGKVARAVQ